MPWRHIYVAEILLNSFLTSALGVTESLASCLGRFPLRKRRSGTHGIRGWMAPGPVRTFWTEIFFPYRETEPRTVQSTAQCLCYFTGILFVFYDRKSFVKDSTKWWHALTSVDRKHEVRIRKRKLKNKTCTFQSAWGIRMPRHFWRQRLHFSSLWVTPRVSNPQPARRYHAARGHNCKLCM